MEHFSPLTANIFALGNAKVRTVKRDGQANASNIMCVSKTRIGELICTLPNADMKLIDAYSEQ